MIIVTGGLGFIGSAIARSLAADGHDLVICDVATDPSRLALLGGAAVRDVLGPDELLRALASRSALVDAEAVVHQGAISATDHPDHDELMAVNVGLSEQVLGHCLERRIPLVYASSAAVYGASATCQEVPRDEVPLNAYGTSKLRFDQRVRAVLADTPAPVAGLRYFNVYGPGEAHKAKMASMAHQLHHQLARDGEARLFGATPHAGPGEQRRDFVHVDDVVAVVRWFLDHPEASGTFNCGTGQARSFNELAEALLRHHRGGRITYVPIPDQLVPRYQEHTCADLTRLRAVGCDVAFTSLEDGIDRFVATAGAAS